MREIRPISELGGRIQEAGRIRLGAKKVSAKKPGSALSTFRFTSPHNDLILELANLYGGEPKEWHEPKAKHPDQWELVSDASTIPVLVPPGGLSQWYELWKGSGCIRRCDGETCSVPAPKSSPDEARPEHPCICREDGARACDPKTRITVVLPEITFRGTWRCDTGSWFAAEELPAVESMLDQLQQTHVIVEANLTIEQRQQMTDEGKRKFVVPVLSIPHRFTEIAGGGAQFLPASETLPPAPPDPFATPGLPPVRRYMSESQTDADGRGFPEDDEIIDAELVETDIHGGGDFHWKTHNTHLQNLIDHVANLKGLNADELEEATLLGAGDDVNKARNFLLDIEKGDIEVTRFADDGRAIVKRRSKT